MWSGGTDMSDADGCGCIQAVVVVVGCAVGGSPLVGVAATVVGIWVSDWAALPGWLGAVDVPVILVRNCSANLATTRASAHWKDGEAPDSSWPRLRQPQKECASHVQRGQTIF